MTLRDWGQRLRCPTPNADDDDIVDLQQAFADYDAGKISVADLESAQDKAAKDSVERMEAAGEKLVTDGEQRTSSYVKPLRFISPL